MTTRIHPCPRSTRDPRWPDKHDALITWVALALSAGIILGLIVGAR